MDDRNTYLKDICKRAFGESVFEGQCMLTIPDAAKQSALYIQSMLQIRLEDEGSTLNVQQLEELNSVLDAIDFAIQLKNKLKTTKRRKRIKKTVILFLL